MVTLKCGPVLLTEGTTLKAALDKLPQRIAVDYDAIIKAVCKIDALADKPPSAKKAKARMFFATTLIGYIGLYDVRGNSLQGKVAAEMLQRLIRHEETFTWSYMPNPRRSPNVFLDWRKGLRSGVVLDGSCFDLLTDTYAEDLRWGIANFAAGQKLREIRGRKSLLHFPLEAADWRS